MTSLIGRIVIEPASPRPGETVRVEVLAADGKAIAGRSDITVNGARGAVHFLQFPTAGKRRVQVYARAAGGGVERRTAELEVKGAPVTFASYGSHMDIAMLGVTQAPANPYQAVLTLGSVVDTRAPALQALKSQLPELSVQEMSGAPQEAAAGGRLALALARNARFTRVEKRPLSIRPKAQQGPARPATMTYAVVSSVFDLADADPAKAVDAGKRRYEWDFGDGSSAVTSSPLVVHDYFAGIDHARGSGEFVVTCHVAHANLTVKRTLTIQSAYALCKRTGVIVPQVSGDIFARKRYTMLSGAIRVYNVEETPLVLERMSVTPRSVDGDAMDLPQPFVALARPISVAPRSSALIGVNVPFVTGAPRPGQLRFDTSGFTVIYAGSCGRLPVRCAAAFDVPAAEWDLRPHLPGVPAATAERTPWPWEEVEKALKEQQQRLAPNAAPGALLLDKATGTVAVALGPLTAAALPRATLANAAQLLAGVYTAADAQHIAQARVAPAGTGQPPRFAVALNTRTALNTVTAPVLHTLSGPPAPGPIAEGQICDPDNLTEEQRKQAAAGQLVCQLSDEKPIEVQMPARWMNARKGDILLSPGGEGIIGGMMLHVQPPQWYSHSGIMTRNYDEITHSTGSRERLMDHLIGISAGSDGFEPGVLKYMWPGAVTQSVQGAIEGEKFPDPEYAKSYTIAAFGTHTVGITHNDQMKMIPPLVVKPDPLQETPAVRAALHAIASDARAAGGRPGVKSKFHYRWYCYTNPAIGNGAPEGPGAGWAQGTRPSVCSSFIWMMAKGRNAHLESSQKLVMPPDLEPGDVAQGAEVRPLTPDGLYRYSAEERLAAGEWLFDTIYNEAYDKAGWLGELLTDGADDVANQFLNAFAGDVADGKDSSAWRNATDADAVSPDNILWWDGPAAGGLWGYAEPALYREPRLESYRVSRWKKSVSVGTIRGKVFAADGKPCAGALVQAYDGKSAASGADGGFALTAVPFGKYALKASKVIDGTLQSVETAVNLSGSELKVDLHLQPPADRYRLAQILVDFWGRDDETFGSDEIDDPGPQYYELELGPDKPVNTLRLTPYKWGGELRVEYQITARLLVNNAIDLEVQGLLYEGTSEDTDDLDGQGGVTFQTPAGATGGAKLTIKNTDEGGDVAVLAVSVKNVRNHA